MPRTAASLRPRRRAAAPRTGRTAEDRVFNTVLDAILDHRLAPGTKLVERELSEIMGASRSAVRAALSRLGHDLLVELRPNRGAVIANPSIAETRDLFSARRVIEAGIVRAVVERMTTQSKSRLKAFMAEEAAAYARQDVKTGQRLSIQFHKVLAELAENSVLERYMEQLICRTPLLALAHTGTRLAYCGVDEHRAVVEALLRRDADAAVALMNSHLAHIEGQLRLDEHTPQRDLAAALQVYRGSSDRPRPARTKSTERTFSKAAE